MLIDFNNLKKKIYDYEFLNYDIIVIGAGPAGIVLCDYIKKNDNSIKLLLIEKGGYSNFSYSRIYSSFLKIKNDSRVFGVGGTSNVWSGISSVFTKSELTDYNSKNCKWPLIYSDLLKYYRKIDNKYQFYLKEILQKNTTNKTFLERKFIGSKSPINFKNFVNINKYDLLYNCNVQYIDEKNKIPFIKINIKKDKLLIIKAKKIILTCGGIETSSLIIRSLKNRYLEKLTNKPYVGKYFMDHPKANICKILYPNNNVIKYELKNRFNKYYYTGLSFKDSEKKNRNFLNSYFRFEDCYFKDQLFKLRYNFFNLKIFRLVLDVCHLLIFISLKIVNLNFFYKIYNVRIFCEMKPNIKNSIDINKSDFTPIIKLNFSEEDIKTINELQKKIILFFSKSPEKENILKINNKNIIKIFATASHHCGGTIYSKDKKKAIVDKNLKIKGLHNIYICSSSVFPTSGSANPTPTICALAIRLSEHLVMSFKR
jgi:hypothetical protein